MRLADITFDEQDRNLFQVSDARLRADALKHSVLPRLHAVLNEAIVSIRRVYGIEALDDSIVSFFPHFRQKRERELDHLYEAAFAGLGGKRVKNKWYGVTRKDNKPVQILPFRFAFYLTEEGLGINLQNYWLKGLTDESHRKLFAFHLQHEAVINMLCFWSEVLPRFIYGGDVRPLSPFCEQYRYMAENGYFANDFFSRESPYPIHPQRLSELIRNYVLFFPVYDSYLQIVKGEPVRFHRLIEQANEWLETQDSEEAQEAETTETDEALHLASVAAEQRVRVMPAIRWQVFQRDNWKCAACGRNSQDGIILQVDHILPRSKGGKDTLDNFQTLCNVCNLGKSNRDSTDLRQQKRETRVAT
jgi:5-methylcytosine-specific restriction endonuclease McrA